MRAVLLDNEAVQALIRPDHRKHRTALAHLAGVVARRRRGTRVEALVPTAVRAEAGWDRSDPRAAGINRFRIRDLPLDSPGADVAATITVQAGVSVADAHLGAAARSLPADEVVVLTSDPHDITAVSQPRGITAARI